MCTSPLKILNRSLHFTSEMPMYYTVPCGKCSECRKKFQSDWFVRCFYEWQVNRNSSYFYTLTYNNDHLPRYYNIPCFSKTDIQLFMKRLRKRLDQIGLKVKYMITSEFGEKFKRPHYHALFFFDHPIAPYRVYKLIEDSWQNGFVKYGDSMGLVTSSSGIQYVTKYVTKDIVALDEYFPSLATYVYNRYTRLFNYIRKRYDMHFPASLHLDVEDHKFTIRTWKYEKIGDEYFPHSELHNYPAFDVAKSMCLKAKRIVDARMPFHLQSINLGKSAVGNITHEDLLNGFIHIPCSGRVQKFSIPRYYKRFFWYDCVENELDGKRNKFVLNDLGKKHYIDSLVKNMNDTVLKFEKIIHNTHFITDDLVSRLNDDCNLNFNKSSLVHFLDNFDLSLPVLAVYSKIFKGRICPFKYEDMPLTDSLVLDNYEDYAHFCTYETSNLDYGKIYEKFCGEDKIELFNLLLWDNHPFFHVYEYALRIFLFLDSSLRDEICCATDKLESDLRSLKEQVQNNYSLF